ncbi:MAG: 16S rRNA (cytosine(1402)-N(4))-methyltransferase RsmH, partial [Chloroflexi bacterium]|nr:16S rRNA (cytosine(1402)-N(4))-methyltransferase RsmH [Chloroflexota bacterium]
IAGLDLKKGGSYIDCTTGTGGHAAAVLERILPGGRLLGIDADPGALKVASDRLARFGNAVTLVNCNFLLLENVARANGFYPVDGILFDLGLSSLQLERPESGFSFQTDAPLDMRFGPDQQLTAAQLVNEADGEELYHIIRDYGEEPAARRIVRSIIKSRPIATTLQLARLIERATGGVRGRIHPATKTFQALRIAVNNELANLEAALGQATNLLATGGRLAVISYHSLEDRIVKTYFSGQARGCICPPQVIKCVCQHVPTLKPVNKKVIRPEAGEVLINPRSRSARLRVAEKL